MASTAVLVATFPSASCRYITFKHSDHLQSSTWLNNLSRHVIPHQNDSRSLHQAVWKREFVFIFQPQLLKYVKQRQMLGTLIWFWHSYGLAYCPFKSVRIPNILPFHCINAFVWFTLILI